MTQTQKITLAVVLLVISGGILAWELPKWFGSTSDIKEPGSEPFEVVWRSLSSDAEVVANVKEGSRSHPDSGASDLYPVVAFECERHGRRFEVFTKYERPVPNIPWRVTEVRLPNSNTWQPYFDEEKERFNPRCPRNDQHKLLALGPLTPSGVDEPRR